PRAGAGRPDHRPPAPAGRPGRPGRVGRGAGRQRAPGRRGHHRRGGKYVDHQDAYKSGAEALKHGGLRQRTRVNLKWLESSDIETVGAEEALAGVDGILVPGGFGDRGFEGKVDSARHAREHGIPYFGICYGMQAAVVDYARNVAGLEGANSTENDKASPHPVIGLITEWRTATGDVERRNEESDLGGTMRLGLQDQ